MQPHIGSTFFTYNRPTNIFFAHELRYAESEGVNTRVLSAKTHRRIYSVRELNGFLRIPVVGLGNCFLYQGVYVPRAESGRCTNFGILRILPGHSEELRLSFFVQGERELCSDIEPHEVHIIGGLITLFSDSMTDAWERLSINYSKLKHDARSLLKNTKRHQSHTNAFMHIEDPIENREIVLVGNIK